MMNKRTIKRKVFFVFGIISFLAITLSSCRREGCPNKITEVRSVIFDSET